MTTQEYTAAFSHCRLVIALAQANVATGVLTQQQADNLVNLITVLIRGLTAACLKDP
jgi:hypothetical protein